MESLISKIVAKNPKADKDLVGLFENIDVCQMANYLSGDEDILFEVTSLIRQLGFKGGEKMQKTRLQSLIKRIKIPCIKTSPSYAEWATSLEGMTIINPIFETRTMQWNEHYIFMTPPDLLALCTSADTPEAHSLREALWIFFISAKEELNELAKKDTQLQVSLFVYIC